MIAALLLAAVAAAAQSPQPQPDEIVVRAVRQKCRVQLAERIVSQRELDERAKEWAQGKPVRVVAPASIDHKCLVKIAFRLAARGVRLMEFVESADSPSDPGWSAVPVGDGREP